ncbi:hypothetical protein ZHAS_00007379 [Anopheles sinensis]|uniref:Uncharacterized protein n=1 Tax=Anopheles sinensis TaxID=74873 RepID=A0A084VPU7_ANOSI|nr:hypothetical protein ZHAS_00007379 [Anopheles sinensis]
MPGRTNLTPIQDLRNERNGGSIRLGNGIEFGPEMAHTIGLWELGGDGRGTELYSPLTVTTFCRCVHVALHCVALFSANLPAEGPVGPVDPYPDKQFFCVRAGSAVAPKTTTAWERQGTTAGVWLSFGSRFPRESRPRRPGSRWTPRCNVQPVHHNCI